MFSCYELVEMWLASTCCYPAADSVKGSLVCYCGVRQEGSDEIIRLLTFVY